MRWVHTNEFNRLLWLVFPVVVLRPYGGDMCGGRAGRLANEVVDADVGHGGWCQLRQLACGERKQLGHDKQREQ